MKLDRSKLLAALVALGGLAYTASPIDAIPDFLPGIGFSDDAVALVGATIVIVRIMRNRARRQRSATKS